MDLLFYLREDDELKNCKEHTHSTYMYILHILYERVGDEHRGEE